MQMFSSVKLSFEKSGSLNALVLDYLNQHHDTQEFYGHAPNLSGFKALLREKPYAGLDRGPLYTIIRNQQGNRQLSASSKKNLELLKEKNTFTVTTGHQLCLFTGPLYFVYKILSTIKLCETLKMAMPEYDFVPVYWMATEDHDFEEVNHFHVFGKTLQWASEEKGAVGNFSTQSLQGLYEEFKSIIGESTQANTLLQLFKDAYLGQANLSDATGYLANVLFGEHGLIIVDGDDKAFKSQFVDTFEKDIFENFAAKAVKNSIQTLQQRHYPVQVKPRDINCFMLGEQTRYRIEAKDGKFKLVGSDQVMTAEELKNIIRKTPEKISPNVLLRPLYQQHILPNIAYVGGPGELAYWLELKEMFDARHALFPILVPRNFLSIIDRGLQNKMERLKLEPADFFLEENKIIDKFQLGANATFNLDEEKTMLEKLYAVMAEKMALVDKTLSGSIKAESQKSMNGIIALEGKANKALKQKSETEINQIKTIKQKLFPGNVPQERYDNFTPYFLKYGSAFFAEVYRAIQPLDFQHQLLLENKTPAEHSFK